VDEDFGPKTVQALRRYQGDHGLVADGVVRQELLTRLQADLARQEGGEAPPLVIVAQPSIQRQSEGHRGKANLGIDLAWLYHSSGFTVFQVENPTLEELAGTIGKAIESGHIPSIVHLSGGLREFGGGVGFTFLAGEWWSEALSGSRFSDDISVTSLDRVLARFPRDSFRPLVILDVDRPSAASDTIDYLFLRNAFAGDLFALGRCSAVLATGLTADARQPVGLYEQLIRLLAAQASFGETCSRVRRQTPPMHGDDLELALPLAGIALFTHLPWLRIVHV